MTRRFVRPLAAATAMVWAVSPAFSQDSDDEEEIDEVVVVGSQIRGASISEALAVSVVDAETIEILGIDSGDELLDLLPENGQNFFNEAENISGGVNAARGDVGAYNLRSLGTGNTLVLLNGRRLVNTPGYQTEEVGGSFVPVNTVNSNALPVRGMQRVEVLRDGASAIYGADAVAGVVNHVMRSDFEGFRITARHGIYDHVPRDDQTLNLEWGRNLNGGSTNVSVFAGYYTRDRVNAQDEARWSNSDLRSRLPELSPFGPNASSNPDFNPPLDNDNSFRNDSANSLFGQFDILSSVAGLDIRNTLVDTAGEFETYPLGDPRCQYTINATTCGGVDGQGTFRYNLNEFRDLSSQLDRYNVAAFINHDFDNGVSSFTEIMAYRSDSNLNRHPSAPFSTSRLEVPAENYYNPFGVAGNPNRLPDALVGNLPAEGVDLLIDNYRFAELPRVINVEGEQYRFVQGFRGTNNEWDWEGAFVWSYASSEDITSNRVSNNLIEQALNDPTPAAYNPFSGGVDNNIERALIDVARFGETRLTSFDFKISKPALFELPGGSVGFLAGYEHRAEKFLDDRDARLDGTIAYTDRDGDTFPFVSDVVNSSPTPDSSGRRDVDSLFFEFAIPLHETLDVQAALRYEDFSDVGDTTVGKIAAGWRPIEQVLLRGSWSEAFRAPNLVTINEEIVARNNTRTDFACLYAALEGGDPNEDVLDCTNSIQRIAQGSTDLRPEESTNTSIGLVLTPIEGLTITADWWSIEKEDTIGLFGEENHTLLDLVIALETGTADCANFAGNPAVSRGEIDQNEVPFYNAAGICPLGPINFVDDRYANLDTRTVSGYDIGIYYDFDSPIGTFNLQYIGSFLDEFEQDAGGDAAVLLAAQQNGVLPEGFPVVGFADLIGQDGNQDERHRATVTWRGGDFGASVSGFRVGSFFQSSLSSVNGLRYTIPEMTTYNATFTYWADDLFGGTDARFRLGVRNFTDERAPLADRFFGYFADAHRDLGVSYFLDVRLSFDDE